MITLISLLGAVLGAPTFLDSSAGFGFFNTDFLTDSKTQNPKFNFGCPKSPRFWDI